MKIELIKPNKDNPRVIRGNKFDKLVNSIKEFPEMLKLRPIVIDEDNIILGGNMRYKACVEAGLKDIPVKVAKGLTEEQKKEFIIKDNVGFGEWDWDILANDWSEKQIEEWGLDVWQPEEIDEVLEAVEDDYTESDNMQVDVVLGDLIEIGEHRLLCGDSTDVTQLNKIIKDEKCNLLTDPPYGINANKQTLGTGKKQFHRGNDWDFEIPDFYYAISLVDKAIIWGGNYFADKLEITNDWLCWHKKNDGLSFSEFELAWSNIGKNCRHISHHWSGEQKQHPTMKPLKVIEWCINLLDNKPILDLFLGSGTTMVAAHQLNRKCYGIELDPKYCQVIIDRMLKLDDSLVVKINGKLYEQN
jgi:DNA modification methylase